MSFLYSSPPNTIECILLKGEKEFIPGDEWVSAGSRDLPWTAQIERFVDIPKGSNPEFQPNARLDINNQAQFRRMARLLAKSIQLPQDKEYADDLKPVERYNETYISLINKKVICYRKKAMADQLKPMLEKAIEEKDLECQKAFSVTCGKISSLENDANEPKNKAETLQKQMDWEKVESEAKVVVLDKDGTSRILEVYLYHELTLACDNLVKDNLPGVDFGSLGLHDKGFHPRPEPKLQPGNAGCLLQLSCY
ncbi:hypothetical protein ACH5RR_001177 [Cinchona calisaya]|uniref:Uncharacterized protein n=1 Tax=Cinchona calisaya TaxID=153742 RepID=A0ABD3B2X5_9GENT